MTYQDSAIERLALDTKRYLIDNELSATVRSKLKLLMVVDYWPVLWFRLAEYSQERRSPWRWMVGKLAAILKPVAQGMSGARIYIGAHIEGGLLLHQSAGVVFAPGAFIGKDCTAYAGVAVVHKANGKKEGAAIIHEGVQLGIGCKIVGPVTIGSHAVIAANSVVLTDVPASSLAAGIPARVVGPRRDQ